MKTVIGYYKSFSAFLPNIARSSAETEANQGNCLDAVREGNWTWAGEKDKDDWRHWKVAALTVICEGLNSLPQNYFLINYFPI